MIQRYVFLKLLVLWTQLHEGLFFHDPVIFLEYGLGCAVPSVFSGTGYALSKDSFKSSFIAEKFYWVTVWVFALFFCFGFHLQSLLLSPHWTVFAYPPICLFLLNLFFFFCFHLSLSFNFFLLFTPLFLLRYL